jgi:hypothetical protein
MINLTTNKKVMVDINKYPNLFDEGSPLETLLARRKRPGKSVRGHKPPKVYKKHKRDHVKYSLADRICVNYTLDDDFPIIDERNSLVDFSAFLVYVYEISMS